MDTMSPETFSWTSTNTTFFTGLSSSDELKVATIGLPLISSGIRIRPVNWQNDIAIRMEILTFCTKAGPTEFTYSPNNTKGDITFKAANVSIGFACYIWDVGDGQTFIFGPDFCYNWGSHFSIITSAFSDPISFLYSYAEFGIYTYKVKEITGNGNNTYEQVVYVNGYGCIPYTMKLVDDMQSNNKTRVLQVSEAMHLMAHVNMTCLAQFEDTNYIWSITTLQTGNIKTIPWYDANYQQFEPFYFTEGTFLIRVTVDIQPISLQSFTDNITITVHATPLEVHITGGDTSAVGNGADVQIDASELSYDPDNRDCSAHGINFQWKCSKVLPGEVLQDCRYVNVDIGSIYIPKSELTINSTVWVQVTATKGTREANRTKVISVMDGNPLDVYISCGDTCADKVTTLDPLVLSGECGNCDDENLLYQWKLLSNTETVTDFEHMTSTGFAAVTLFQLSCSGWKSESRQQLTYSFKAVSNHTEFLIYNSQLSQTPSLLLPVGDLDTQGTLDLRASVCNSVRACTSARIQVKITDSTINHAKYDLATYIKQGITDYGVTE
ncbi:uncharacterized protein LOC144937492 [Lampetra fluviatilis]